MCFACANYLTLSALQNKLDTCANSVHRDEADHNEPSLQDLHCLPFWFEFGLSLFATRNMSKFSDEKAQANSVDPVKIAHYEPSHLIFTVCKGSWFDLLS